MKITSVRIAVLAVLLAILAAVYGWLFGHGEFGSVFTEEGLKNLLRTVGPWGPAMVVLLMIAAIVISPLPSAPIALAAGALYGHAWGTVYILLGAELGAIIAFLLSRYFCAELVHRAIGNVKILEGRETQNALTAVVFISRLIPFISFDVVSYAAGLTNLKLWRFILATGAGIVPASFFLAHIGAGLASFDGPVVASALFLLGAGVFLSMIIGRMARKKGTS